MLHDTLPNDWLQSIFVTIPKKPNAKKCYEYRNISLKSHALKIFLSIILNIILNNARIYKNMSQEQLGFRNGLGTSDALFSTKYLFNVAVISTKIYICALSISRKHLTK